MDGVTVTLGSRVMTVEAARQCARNNEWKSLVHMEMIEFHAAFLLGSCVLSDRPPALWGLLHLKMGGMPFHD